MPSRFRLSTLMIIVALVGIVFWALASTKETHLIAMLTVCPLIVMFCAAHRPPSTTLPFIKSGVVTGIVQHVLSTIFFWFTTSRDEPALYGILMLMVNVGAGTAVGIITEIGFGIGRLFRSEIRVLEVKVRD